MTVSHTLRRRVDYQILRWQARLDGAWADRVIPWVAMVGLFLVLALLALARVRSFETGTDLGAWVQGAWLITSGHALESTVTGRHLLEPQLAVGFYGLAQVTRLIATTPALVVLQAFALSLGIPAVWRICRQVCTLRVGGAGAAIIAYAAYPPLHQLNLADLHPAAFALPALLWGGYFSLQGRWRWAVPLFVVAVSMRSDLGLTVAAIGMSITLSGRGRGGRRLALGGVAWTVLAQLILQPAIGGDGFVHREAFAAYGDDALGVLWGLVSSPWQVLGDLLARDNFAIAVGLLAPVAFLPVVAIRRFVPFVAVVAVAFVADVPIEGAEGIELLVPAVVGVFLTIPFALEQLGRRNIERVSVDHRLVLAVVLASVTFFTLDSPSSPYAHPWEWGSRDQADRERIRLAEAVPDDARVRAAPSVLAELAERRVVRSIPTDAAPTIGELTAGVDVVILAPELAEGWEDGEESLQRLREQLPEAGFELVHSEVGVGLYAATPD